MIHARKDYARIQDPWGKIGQDEPVFLVRGQDKLLVPILNWYLTLYSAEETPDPVIMGQISEQITRAEEWARTHPERMKLADAPREDCGCEPK